MNCGQRVKFPRVRNASWWQVVFEGEYELEHIFNFVFLCAIEERKNAEGNVELVPNQRVVQAWRPTHWDPGVYSIVRFELRPRGSETLVDLDHSSFPEGEFDHLEWGWNNHYGEPLKKFLV